MSDKQTRERILDVAEKLFAENGFEGTSLRAIASAADVNLAATHYHFGSKIGLLQAAVQRRVGPVNEARIRRLDEAIEAAGDDTPTVEAILDAFVRPTVEAMRDFDAQHLVGFYQIMHSREVDPEFFRDTFGEVLRRFAILADALPHLTPDELSWRFHFLVGSLMQSFNRRVAEIHPELDRWDTDERVTAIVTYAAAGFRAPATRSPESTGNDRRVGQETTP